MTKIAYITKNFSAKTEKRIEIANKIIEQEGFDAAEPYLQAAQNVVQSNTDVVASKLNN
jgi:hypothetical protein